ncbi:PH domain-containing protein [Micromonospora sp. NPDC005806]|uniref:PH domain-containing protein n=1 Tax=Micromonospora sp. NPDC005806 TaxID=3364234 RepID=UPI0036B58D66
MTGIPVSAPPPPQAAPPPPQPQLEPGVLWAAKGQPLTGIGGGRYKLTATMLFFEKGVLSTNAQQVPVAHVLDVDLRQSIVQKGRGVGNIVVQVQRSNGVEWVILEDVPDPRNALSIINKAVQDARLIEQQRMNTRIYAGLPPVVPEPQPAPATPTPPPAAAPDPIEQLRQLGQLRDAGILSEQEFATKKAEILSRL